MFSFCGMDGMPPFGMNSESPSILTDMCLLACLLVLLLATRTRNRATSGSDESEDLTCSTALHFKEGKM